MTDEDILERVRQGLVRAKRLHPRFAEGKFHALGYLGEEYSEVVRALTKNEGEQRMQEELIDLVVVAWRMLRGDHEDASLCDDCKSPCEECGKEGWEWFFSRNMTRL